jgi:hypothetical protein
MLEKLAGVGLIYYYEVDGNQYIEMPDWFDHQTFHGFTPVPSEYPNHEGKSTSKVLAENLTEPGRKREVKRSKEKLREEVTSEVGTSDPTSFDKDSEPHQLAVYLVDCIRKNKPDFKPPNLQKWAKGFDAILRIDGRQLEEVSGLIKWVQSDDFEMVNVLSPSKLRKRYDQLVMKATKDLGKRPWIAWEDDDEV